MLAIMAGALDNRRWEMAEPMGESLSVSRMGHE
jgi:hypothetical protein